MRLAVLDVGSNTAHLQVVDAYPGGPPRTVYRLKKPTRLAEAVAPDGALCEDGIARLVTAVTRAAEAARAEHVSELIPLATATVRDATNAADIRERVRAAAGLDLVALSGEDEARLTFLAVRRWLGWSAGSLLLLDIGGASMEIAYGGDENPHLAVSLPLGAGLLTRKLLPRHPARWRDVKQVRRHVVEVLGALTEVPDWRPQAYRYVGTSKTFKQLARLTGAAAWGRGAFIPRGLRRGDLRQWIPRLARMDAEQRAGLPGVCPARARQLLAGAVTAEAVMDVLGIDRIDVCPWALREGVLLRRIDTLGDPIEQHQSAVLERARHAVPAMRLRPIGAPRPVPLAN